jgi:hypothetical protein
MPLTTDAPGAPPAPSAPMSLDDTGLSFGLIMELVLRVLHGNVELTGAELARRIGVVFPVLVPCLEYLKTQRHCEIAGGSMVGGPSLRYRLTEAGHARAVASLERTMYAGRAPVPIAQYRAYMARFTRETPRRVSREQVIAAFGDLVVSDRTLDELGPAINNAHSMFLYGPPGNGKSTIAKSVRRLMGGTIAIPYAIEVAGQIIRFFDPSIHEVVPVAEAGTSDRTGARSDARWVHCRRPMVTVGGEMSLESLALAFNPRSGVYIAPVQALANGGVLVIDDFGRQRCAPQDLLNWWMVPLESRIEFLALASGEKFEMPFDPFIIFSTNLRPADLVDEAFLRRIHYKIYAENPSPLQFATIFEHCCRARNIPYDPALVDYLLTTCYLPRGIELRACHPRDLIDQALSLADYRGMERLLTTELLSRACASYFLDEREAASPPVRA